jgi:hypothetical protein
MLRGCGKARAARTEAYKLPKSEGFQRRTKTRRYRIVLDSLQANSCTFGRVGLSVRMMLCDL